MAYIPPARGAVKLVTGAGAYSPPSRTAVAMQRADDPLRYPNMPVLMSVSLNEIVLGWVQDGADGFNPHATHMGLYVWDGTAWVQLATTTLVPNGTIKDPAVLPQGNGYLYQFRMVVQRSPTSTAGVPSLSLLAWTDYILEVVSCRDSAQNILADALIIALPEEAFPTGVSGGLVHSATGQDWPARLPYRRCNRTDAFGQCSIRIPGGQGKAMVLMIPPDPNSNVGGDILVHVLTRAA